MKAYRHSVKLKLGLIVFAVLIAVMSLAYTNQLVERLRDREQFMIQLWASAQEQIASASRAGNPYLPVFRELSNRLANPSMDLTIEERERYNEALAWARSMPPSSDVTLASEIVLQGDFGIPAIITDSTLTEINFWHNVPVSDSLNHLSEDARRAAMARLRARAVEMSQVHEPIVIELGPGANKLKQYIFYDESRLVRELRVFPYVQLLFVALFILVGYMGFSYVRRSEQSSLWVGMAKEAAHQLGTPISSLMGWIELMKVNRMSDEEQQQAIEEVEKDVARLNRVAGRFSDIGSLPKLEVCSLEPVIQTTADYMRRRMPQRSDRVTLHVSVPRELYAPLNVELFEWVIENLLKNALDAIETDQGKIELTAAPSNGQIVIEVKDSGKGIDRRNWRNVFRPGYSTKKRGWGLGLSLAKRIVEDYHGGSLTLAQSRLGHGSTFRIVLPRADQQGHTDRNDAPMTEKRSDREAPRHHHS